MKYATLIKYIALNILLGVAYYELFLYLASVQGGGSIMVAANPFLILGLVVTSSIALTIGIYSIISYKNRTRNHAKINETAASIGTIVMGTGLCGCNTAFPLAAATALGVSSTGTFALGAVLKNYSTPILAGLVIINILVISYYSNKFSKPTRKR